MGVRGQVTPQAMANNAQRRQTRPVLLMTRSKTDSQRFVDSLNLDLCAQATVIMAPLIAIVPTENSADLQEGEGAIFSSSHGVAFAPEGAGRVAHCVGRRTGEAATAAGWQVRHVAQTADELVATIAAEGPLVHLSGKHHRGDISERLQSKGIPCRRRILYDQVLQALTQTAQDALLGEQPVIVPLFSPRTAAQLVQQARSWARAHVLAISEAVASELGGVSPAQMHIASAPTGSDMRRGVEMLLQKASLP